MGFATARDHAGGDAAKRLAQRTLARAAAPDARRLLLRVRATALSHLARPRPRLVLARHLAGHRKASVHHDWFRGAVDAHPTRDHIDQRHDASPGKTLEIPAPADLSDRSAG